MKSFIITKEMAEKHGILLEKMERVFQYSTFQDMENTLDDMGYKDISIDKLEEMAGVILLKYEDDILERMISYLEYREVLVRKRGE